MPRLLFVDDNIHSIEGHYFELATLLMQGAEQLGYRPELATHVDFDATGLSTGTVFQAFQARRMLSWSLGVDGRSRVRRDVQGRPVGGHGLQNRMQWLRDRFSGANRRPQELLSRWSDDLVRWMRSRNVCRDDGLVINTGDDFLLLALSNALVTLSDDAPRNAHVIFHFAVCKANQVDRRAQQFGEQVNLALNASGKHSIQLHATTQSLAQQLQSVGVEASAIAYPTRNREPVPYSSEIHPGPLKILLAGLPRREKGIKSISKLLSMLSCSHLRTGDFRVSMQLPKRKWRRIVPAALHANCSVTDSASREQVTGSNTETIEVITSSLATRDYHDWLDTADVGLFLYDADRYVARCSGVLLELLVRGIPVIVPDNCWLADQVRAANECGTVGRIYKTVNEIPELLSVMAADYDNMRQQALRFACVIARRHHPTETLLAMGIKPATQSVIAA